MHEDETTTCLDPERLDAVRSGEASAAEKAHAAGCPRCRRLLEEIEAMARELRAAKEEANELPPQIKATVMAAFRESVEKTPPVSAAHPAHWMRWAAPLAAAAGIALLAVGIGRRDAPLPMASRLESGAAMEREERAVAQKTATAPETTILDAYRLALALKKGASLDPRADANADGAVDGADVAALAMRAVRLTGG